VQWYAFIIPALERLRQEYYDFEVGLRYTVRPCLTKTINQSTKVAKATHRGVKNSYNNVLGRRERGRSIYKLNLLVLMW
jgi:hypothetical protein